MKEIENIASKRALNPTELRELIRERANLGSGGEFQWLELKRGLASKGHRKREDWTKLLVQIVSMANSGGGFIIFGVSNEGELVGINNQTIDLLDPSRIQDQLKKYSPESNLATQLTVTEYYEKKYASIWVSPSKQLIIFDENGDYTTQKGDQKQAFKKSVLYVRDPGGIRRASQTDLNQLIQERLENRLTDFIAKIEQVAHIPIESDLLASHPENPQRAYRLVEKGEGQPVRISSDPDEKAVPLREVLRTDIPYQDVNHEVSAQVRFWKSKPDHRISREVCFGWFLKRDEIDWNVDSARFCFLSACHSWGYPMYWAKWLFDNEPDILRGTIDEMLASPKYPDIEYLPYVGPAFFWEERKNILEEVEDSGYRQAGHNAEKIMAFDDKRTFLLNARSSSSLIHIGEEEFVKAELLENRDVALQAFERIIELRKQIAEGKVKSDQPSMINSVGHQLDLISFPPFTED